MGVRRFCSRDPLLDFIHETFGATAVRVPDPRWKPLAIFRTDRARVRYLGLVGDLEQASPIGLPAVENAKLPNIELHQSSYVGWKVAADLLGPILEQAIGVGLGVITASFEVARGRETKTSISLARTRRIFVPPIRIARWIDEAAPAVPAPMVADLAARPIYVVDSVLVARKINVLLEGAASAEVTAKLAVALGPSVPAESVVRTDSRVSIDMPRVAPFAFTAIEVGLDAKGVLRDVRTERGSVRAAAAPVELFAPVSRPTLAGPDEMFDFDD